jgi:hypothetical protein
MRGRRTHQHQWPTGLTRSLEEQAGNLAFFQRGPTCKQVLRPSSKPANLLWHLAGVIGWATVDSPEAGLPPVMLQRLTTCHQLHSRQTLISSLRC